METSWCDERFATLERQFHPTGTVNGLVEPAQFQNRSSTIRPLWSAIQEEISNDNTGLFSGT
jgi:hypothetical protein